MLPPDPTANSSATAETHYDQRHSERLSVAETSELTEAQLDGMDMWGHDVMLDERHRAVGAMLVSMAVAEIRRHRGAKPAEQRAGGRAPRPAPEPECPSGLSIAEMQRIASDENGCDPGAFIDAIPVLLEIVAAARAFASGAGTCICWDPNGHLADALARALAKVRP